MLTSEAAKILVQAFVGGRIDYCNSLLHGTSAKNIHRLQVVQNDLARAVLVTGRRSSATESLKTLHWLPITERINYKIAVTVYKLRQSHSPQYLSELLVNYQ